MQTFFSAVALLCCFTASVAGADFAIRDGDTVVFLGDSITAERTYGKIVENYTILRFPDRRAHFINAGHGGETMAGALKRLDRDVFERGATLLIVAYGINDIGWGAKADAEHRQLYLDSVRTLVQRCKEKGVRVFICSAAATGADPDKAENDFLQKMCDEGMAISRSLGEGSIDVLREMRAIQKRIKTANAKERDESKKTTLHAADTIHLNDLGQTAMAFAILKGLGAPSDVSAVTIDADDVSIAQASGCAVSNVSMKDGVLEFDRLDEGLPYNAGLFTQLKFRFIPIPEINRYMLTVKGLKAGKYDVIANDRGVGTFNADALAKGVNISSSTADPWLPGGPWHAQGWSLAMLTDGRSELVTPLKYSDEFLKVHPARADIEKRTTQISGDIEALQRQVAKPFPYHFVLRPSTRQE